MRGKKKILQSLFLNKGGKKITKHQLEYLAVGMVSRSHNFQTCLDKNHSQNREAQVYILMHKQHFDREFPVRILRRPVSF